MPPGTLSSPEKTRPLEFMRHRLVQGTWWQASNLISYTEIAYKTSTSKDVKIIIERQGGHVEIENNAEKNGVCCSVHMVFRKVKINLEQIIDRDVIFFQHNYKGELGIPEAFLWKNGRLNLIGIPGYLTTKSIGLLPIILHELGHVIGHPLDPGSEDRHEIALGERSAWHHAHKLYRQLKRLGFPIGELCSETDFEKIKLCALRSHAKGPFLKDDFPAPFIKGIRAKILPGCML